MLLVCVTPPIKAGPADAKIPASFAGIADLLRVLKHLKFALNVAFFVRHEYFLHPKSGNLQEVSRESVHIYTLRRTAATLAGDLGAPPHIVGVILGHSNIGGQLVAGYNHSTYQSEHSQILQHVADRLEVIERGEATIL